MGGRARGQARVSDFNGNRVPNTTDVVTMVLTDATTSASRLLPLLEVGPGVLQTRYALSRTGAYTLAIRAAGEEVDGSPFAVTGAPTPPPQMVSAAFTDNLNAIRVAFDRATNRGGALAAGSECANFFVAATVELLGTGPTCTWATDSQLVVFLGAEPGMQEADLVMLRTGVIVNQAQDSYAASGVLSVTLPAVVPAPRAILSGPSMVGVCDALTLDASASAGGGGRRLEFR